MMPIAVSIAMKQTPRMINEDRWATSCISGTNAKPPSPRPCHRGCCAMDLLSGSCNDLTVTTITTATTSTMFSLSSLPIVEVDSDNACVDYDDEQEHDSDETILPYSDCSYDFDDSSTIASYNADDDSSVRYPLENYENIKTKPITGEEQGLHDDHDHSTHRPTTFPIATTAAKRWSTSWNHNAQGCPSSPLRRPCQGRRNDE